MWPPIGVFQHVNQCYPKGRQIDGMSLDSLHSDEIDPDGLKAWTCVFSNYFSRESKDGLMGSRPKFKAHFLDELRCFCVYVASLDGPLSENVVDAINWLLDDSCLNCSNVEGLVRYTHTNEWTRWYPKSFEILVLGVAQDANDWDGSGITAASQVFYYYLQVARFLYSIRSNESFYENSAACCYLDSYRKYVERTSISEFHSPLNDKSIEDVCRTWQYLTDTERDIFGVWVSAAGNPPFAGGPLSFTLGKNGQGYMVSKPLLVRRNTTIIWGFAELITEIVPEIGVPALDIRTYLELKSPAQIRAKFSCPGKRWNNTIAVYQRPNW